MALIPIFVPKEKNGKPYVEIKNLEFTWYPGQAVSQFRKSIDSLHKAGEKEGIVPILEISSKAESKQGRAASAFNLHLIRGDKTMFVESVFQGSKVFENGGPYSDLYDKKPCEVKKDSRLKKSGNLVGFKFFEEHFDQSPMTFFYDWIYINALHENKELVYQVMNYNGFSDIVFNPKKSFNCQAYSAALYVSLCKFSDINEVLKSRESFLEILRNEYNDKDNIRYFQPDMNL